MVTTQQKEQSHNYLPEGIAGIAAGAGAYFGGRQYQIHKNLKDMPAINPADYQAVVPPETYQDITNIVHEHIDGFIKEVENVQSNDVLSSAGKNLQDIKQHIPAFDELPNDIRPRQDELKNLERSLNTITTTAIDEVSERSISLTDAARRAENLRATFDNAADAKNVISELSVIAHDSAYMPENVMDSATALSELSEKVITNQDQLGVVEIRI